MSEFWGWSLGEGCFFFVFMWFVLFVFSDVLNYIF